MKKNIYLCNVFPCENNTYLANRIFTFLSKNGHILARQPKDADTIIVTTCVVTQEAEDVCLKAIRHFRKLYGLRKRLIVYGCLSKIRKKDENTYDAIYISPHHLDRFNALFQHKIPIQAIDENVYKKTFQNEAQKVYRVMIAQGCVNVCSYCTIKLAKGGLKSKRLPLVMKEIRAGLDKGHRHLKLIADDCSCYGLDIKTNFGALLRQICGLNKNMRLDIHYIEPSRFLRFFDDIKLAVERGILKDMNIPLQTTSQRILKLMNRHYDIQAVLEGVKHLKERYPVFISTDVMIGFPTETRNEFLDNITKTPIFDMVNLFLYSPRKRTPAVSLKPRITGKEAGFRRNIALTLEKKFPNKYQFTKKFNQYDF